VTAAGVVRGLSLHDLVLRLPERRLPWLEAVVLDELERGRVARVHDGRLTLVDSAFAPETLRALRTIDDETGQRPAERSTP
jgi:hypothetical protein